MKTMTMTRLVLKLKLIRFKRWLLALLYGIVLLATLPGCSDARVTTALNLFLLCIGTLLGLGTLLALGLFGLFLVERGAQ